MQTNKLQSLLKDMSTDGIEPAVDSYVEVVNIFTIVRLRRHAIDTVRTIRELNFHIVIDALCKANELDESVELL